MREKKAWLFLLGSWGLAVEAVLFTLINGCKDCVTHLQGAASALSTRQGTSCLADCRHAAAAGCRVPSPGVVRCTMHMP